MKFALSNGNSFEIPDDWWNEAGMPNFRRSTICYEVEGGSALEIVNLRLVQIEPPIRMKPLDFGGFVHDRLVRILRGFVDGSRIPPVPVLPTAGIYPHRIYNGFHRFYASVAAGFESIPTVKGPEL